MRAFTTLASAAVVAVAAAQSDLLGSLAGDASTLFAQASTFVTGIETALPSDVSSDLGQVSQFIATENPTSLFNELTSFAATAIPSSIYAEASAAVKSASELLATASLPASASAALQTQLNQQQSILDNNGANPTAASAGASSTGAAPTFGAGAEMFALVGAGAAAIAFGL